MTDWYESKRLDINYKWRHGDLFPIMLNAGKFVSTEIRKSFGDKRKILVFCGHGNNGGDGIVAAGYLCKENDVKVLVFQNKSGNVSDLNMRAQNHSEGLSISVNPPVEEVDRLISWSEIIVDALLGVGVSGKLKEPYYSLVQKINSSGKRIVSVDIPTGFGTDAAVIPNYTLTFTDMKKGMNEKNSGKISVGGIGMDNEAAEETGPGDMIYFPLLKLDGHKGQNGRLHIFAGWESSGAGIISSRASQSSLVDLVSISVPESKYQIFTQRLTGEMVIETSEKERESEIVGRASAILIGPGLGKTQSARNKLVEILKLKKPTVIDADAIRMCSEFPELLHEMCILTPHRTEFEILSKGACNDELVREFTKKFPCTVLLKGQQDFITNGKLELRSTGGSPRMAMGGTGDMLAGLTAGFLARGMIPFRSASLASFVNKVNSERVAAKRSYWFNVEDLLDELGNTMKFLHEFIGT